MITINGQSGEEYVIDLNKSDNESYTFDVSSVTDGGSVVNWFVDSIVDDFVYVEPNGTDSFIATINISDIQDEKDFYVRNTIGDAVKVVIIPNEGNSLDKNYVFKVMESSVDGNVITLKIKSTADRKKAEWSLVYGGKPLLFDFSKDTGSGTETVKITCLSKVFGTCMSTIKFRQKVSDLCLKVIVKDVDNVLTVEDVIEGC